MLRRWLVLALVVFAVVLLPRRHARAFLGRIEIADPPAHRQQALLGERKQPHLRRPQVVEARVLAERDLHALVQGGEPLQALVPLEEVPRAGHH